jgi:DNA recombination protein RmuC
LAWLPLDPAILAGGVGIPLPTIPNQLRERMRPQNKPFTVETRKSRKRDPQLFEDAIAKRVLIVTPTTLIAMAKAVAFGWRQEKVAENARAVADLGRELYKRLRKMGTHLFQLRASLDRTVKSYNALIGNVEGSVLPLGRKFTDLSVEGTQEPLARNALVEREVRAPRSDGELILEESVSPESELQMGPS